MPLQCGSQQSATVTNFQEAVTGTVSATSAGESLRAEQAGPQASRIVTMMQRDTARFLDAHEIASLDFQVVTRQQQNNDSQLWQIIDV